MGKQSSLAAVFSEVGKPLELQEFEIPPDVEPGAALCRVRMSTICGSDLHTIAGRRSEPTPIILGHEILGEIVALGDGLDSDGFGNKMQEGDRVTWAIMSLCGNCFYCDRALPQKCENLRKYGHMTCREAPHLTGGYAEYIYLFPGTAIFKVPERIPDMAVTPANCAMSTAVNAIETIGLEAGETVLIQGAGMLGLNLAALSKAAGARRIITTDIDWSRLELAESFGADCSILLDGSDGESVLQRVREETDGRGVDVAFEACGLAKVTTQALDALRIGGRYLAVGTAMAKSYAQMDWGIVVRKCLTIKGVHNYRPEHLGETIRFLDSYDDLRKFEGLVGKTFPLTAINDAVREAESGSHIRVAIQ